ncbi:MAG: hypothetical protein JW821_17950 [Deltaproteobacteria bacterium]|nr:hypothetical protein [Deltaproteobacteria bacterium]
MANRLEMLHEDLFKLVQNPGVAKKISHKFSHWIHHVKIRKIAIIFTGIAVGIALSVVTGGASLVVGAAVAMAANQVMKVGEAGVEKIMEARSKRQLKSGNLDAAGQVKKSAHLMSAERGNFERNFGYLLKHVGMLDWVRKNNAMMNDCRSAFEVAKNMYGALIYHEKCEQYFGLYELFVESVFSAIQQITEDFNSQVWIIEDYIEDVVAMPTSEHEKNCRTSRFSKDVCYGMQKQSAKGALNAQILRQWEKTHAGPPHRRIS